MKPTIGRRRLKTISATTESSTTATGMSQRALDMLVQMLDNQSIPTDHIVDVSTSVRVHEREMSDRYAVTATATVWVNEPLPNDSDSLN